jgi:hypothetical protein
MFLLATRNPAETGLTPLPVVIFTGTEKWSSSLEWMTGHLEWHDVRHLEAAEGWRGLGDVAEAKLELAAIPAQKHSNPAVMQVRYLKLF